ncbi:unnamed protein product [Clonostachys rhizophaga]|uniref:Uncharacterized protein n=1 Tax=Clonostachys rhizophaga TaxID=160324 RepID=A0A9N9V477_9HYPO|nr:unnamed protein product [Clonostachys rhizophaga]
MALLKDNDHLVVKTDLVFLEIKSGHLDQCAIILLLLSWPYFDTPPNSALELPYSDFVTPGTDAHCFAPGGDFSIGYTRESNRAIVNFIFSPIV